MTALGHIALERVEKGVERFSYVGAPIPSRPTQSHAGLLSRVSKHWIIGDHIERDGKSIPDWLR